MQRFPWFNSQMQNKCMKRKTWLTRITCFLSSAVLLLTGCMKDKITHTYQISTPIYETLTQFRTQIKSGPARAISSPGKLTRYGRYLFLSDMNAGIHVIDNNNPVAPKNISFINIPGNVDLAIKGNTLYADAYGDLVTLDISNPVNVVARDFKSFVFPDRSTYSVYYPNYLAGISVNPDSISLIIGYETHDTTVDGEPDQVYFAGGCANCGIAFTNTSAVVPSSATSIPGSNGSMARFTIINDYLYTVGWSNMSSIDISQPFNPNVKGSVEVAFHVETIYPLKNNLFVGTNNGMYMYDVESSPSNPALVGEFAHIRGCDPVISDGNYAYVTLNDSSACLGFYDQLQIIDIHNMANFMLVKSYQLTHPMGLSKDGTTLFLCDGKDGLKVYNATDPVNIEMIKQLKDGNMYDVIAADGLATVMASDGIYQYDYSDLNNIHLISKL